MKKNLLKPVFIILLISAVKFSYSQKHYIPGYIINSNGDTTKGFIDYKKWDVNPERISFCEELQGEVKSYSPSEIIEFGVDKNIYVNGIVQFEVLTSNTSELLYEPEMRLQSDTVFLQVIILGPKSLYYFKPPIGNENFYIKQDSLFELLVYRKYLKSINGDLKKAENKRYINQLALYLNNCPSINQKIKNLSYTESSLTKLFENHYKCINDLPQYQKKQERVSFGTGVVGGVTRTDLDFKSKDFYYVANTTFNNSINFSKGLFLDIIFPKRHGRWSIYNELLVTNFDVSGEYIKIKNENDYSVTTSNIRYTYLKMYNMIRFHYPFGKFQVFINGGISRGLAMDAYAERETESFYYGEENLVVDLAIPESRNIEQGIQIGIGCKYKKLSFEARYENGNGMSTLQNLKSTTNRFHFLLGYRFALLK